MAIIPITLFPVVLYFHKHKTGLWPLGFAPFLVQSDGFYTFSDYWKDILKVKIYIHMVNLISILIMLSFPFFFINVLEFRDQGMWWAPIASGTIMGLSHFVIMLNTGNFARIKYSSRFNE